MSSPSTLQAKRKVVDDVLRVFVAFDPACVESCSHARSIYKYLQGGDLEDAQGWTPVPVRYLCSAEALATRELTHAGATPSSVHQNDVLVVMVSDAMLLSAAWRAALEGLKPSAGPGQSWLYPVMLTGNLSKLQLLHDEFDPLRLWISGDGAMPASGELRKPWIARRFGRLRRAFADALLRDFGGLGRSGRLKAFLSHAKADGDGVAQHLRDGLARCSRLSSWYDQSDLVGGRPAGEPMEDAARLSTGGFIAVSTPAYASRPWCRAEAEAARRPRLRETQPGGATVFACQAAVVVQKPSERWGRTVEALGRVPAIGWPAEGATAAALDERTEQVVDRLYLELLLQRRFLLQAAALNEGPEVVFLAFTPDHWSLGKVLDALGAAPAARRLVYPGGGLQPADVQALRGALPDGQANRLSLLSLEENITDVVALSPVAGSPSGWVAVSGGGPSKQLYPAGVGEEHHNDLMVLLTRLIASRGLGISYGGSLSAPSTDNLVDGLLDAARAWRNAEPPLRPAPVDDARFVRNYVAMGFHDRCNDAVRAASLDVCEFILVDAEGQGQPSWSHSLPAETPPQRKRDALSAMRRVSAEETGARVLFGGTITGGADWMPGVAEELLCSLERCQPVALLSGFGGVAAVLARVLRGRGGLPAFSEHPRLLALHGAIEAYRANPGAFPVTFVDETDLMGAVEAVGRFLEGLPPPGPRPVSTPGHVLYDRASARSGETP